MKTSSHRLWGMIESTVLNHSTATPFLSWRDVSLTALLSATLFASSGALAQPTASDDTESLETVTVTGENLYENVGYTRHSTGAATRFDLSPKAIPQALSLITEQRIQDQNLQTVEDVLANTTGISVRKIDSSRVSFFSRGFRINSYQYDGLPTLNTDNRWDFGEGDLNTAIYDHVEVVRGANGLMTGAGNPGASVNFVRKRADSRELTGSLSGSVGRWDQRGTVADVTTPLTQSGDVRARFIGGYEEGDSFLDRFGERKKFGYAVLDADVTENTTLSVGYDYQRGRHSSPTWGGFPLWYSDGGETNHRRSFSVAPDWSYNDRESEKVFADVEHRFGNGWQLRGMATHAVTNLDSQLAYPYGFPERTSGQGVYYYTGWNRGERTVDAVDAYASGPFALFGRQHELVVGSSYSEQSNDYENAFTEGFDAGDFNRWDGSTPDQDWPDFAPSESTSVRQKAIYSAARFSLADPLTLIVGARYSDWSGSSWTAAGGTDTQGQNEITPYGGLIYDLNDTWSAFASYTEIFQPQDYRDANGRFLDPIVGKNYETGLKAAWFDGLLNASLSVFRIEQDNVAQADPLGPGETQTTYHAARGVVSRGVDVEVSGALTSHLDMTFGATHYTATDAEGPYNTDRPRTQVKLFSSYRVPQWQKLTLGGGLNWQSHTFVDDAAGPNGPRRFDQGSYTLANLFGRYQFTPQLAMQVNINNLFDEKYYSYFDGYGVYGEPLNATAAVTYSF